MLTVTIDQSEGISGADIPEQAVKKMRTGSAALSLPSPRAFFAFLFTERLFTTISEPGTGYPDYCFLVKINAADPPSVSIDLEAIVPSLP